MKSNGPVTCTGCGKVCGSWAALANHGRFSKDCTPEMRFWGKVDKRGPKECWPWTATKLPQGYGIVSSAGIGKRLKKPYPVGAHRVAYWLTHGGDFPVDPVCVLHSCDNPSCCNPAHLRLGDRQENSDDKMRRGRYNHRYTPLDKLLHPQFSVKRKP